MLGICEGLVLEEGEPDKNDDICQCLKSCESSQQQGLIKMGEDITKIKDREPINGA